MYKIYIHDHTIPYHTIRSQLTVRIVAVTRAVSVLSASHSTTPGSSPRPATGRTCLSLEAPQTEQTANTRRNLHPLFFSHSSSLSSSSRSPSPCPLPSTSLSYLQQPLAPLTSPYGVNLAAGLQELPDDPLHVFPLQNPVPHYREASRT